MKIYDEMIVCMFLVQNIQYIYILSAWTFKNTQEIQ